MPPAEVRVRHRERVRGRWGRRRPVRTTRGCRAADRRCPVSMYSSAALRRASSTTLVSSPWLVMPRPARRDGVHRVRRRVPARRTCACSRSSSQTHRCSVVDRPARPLFAAKVYSAPSTVCDRFFADRQPQPLRPEPALQPRVVALDGLHDGRPRCAWRTCGRSRCRRPAGCVRRTASTGSAPSRAASCRSAARRGSARSGTAAGRPASSSPHVDRGPLLPRVERRAERRRGRSR